MFIGPSTPHSPAAARALDGFDLRPPIERGQLRQLVAEHPAARVVIVDGLFYHRFAVDHRELTAAVDAGWEVVGMSSMGALRAAEMRQHGVKGFGTVFRLLVEPGLDDDELMLLHEPSFPFRGATLPLIEVRAAFGALVQSGLCPPRVAAHVIDGLQGMWFGSRSWSALTVLLRECDAEVNGDSLGAALRSQLTSDRLLKSLDVRRYVTGQEEMTASLLSCGAITTSEPALVTSEAGNADAR
jgi:hypothetical protein